jgi:hypothetical protein
VSIRKRAGRYIIDIYLGRDPDTGKEVHLSRSAPTRAAAKDLEAQLHLEHRLGAHRPESRRRTVNDLLDAWCAAGSAVWSPTTVYGYTHVMDRELRPNFGHLPVGRLTPELLEAHYNKMRARGLGGRSVRNVHHGRPAFQNRHIPGFERRPGHQGVPAFPNRHRPGTERRCR